MVTDDLVHESLAHEGPGESRTAFEQKLQRLTFVELGEQRVQVEASVMTGKLEHFGSSGAELADPLAVRVGADRDKSRCGVVEDSCRQRSPCLAVDDDA